LIGGAPRLDRCRVRVSICRLSVYPLSLSSRHVLLAAACDAFSRNDRRGRQFPIRIHSSSGTVPVSLVWERKNWYTEYLMSVFIECDIFHPVATVIYNCIPSLTRLFIMCTSLFMVVIDVNLACCVTFAQSEPYCHSILFVCLSVIPRPTAYTTIDRSQPHLVGRYILVLGPV